MNNQQQRILNLLNGQHSSVKAYNRATGQGEGLAKVKVKDTPKVGVVIFADVHRATILLANGHKLECGWPKVALLTGDVSELEPTNT